MLPLKICRAASSARPVGLVGVDGLESIFRRLSEEAGPSTEVVVLEPIVIDATSG